MNKGILKSRLMAALIGVSAASIPIISFADVTYIYTGHNFNSFRSDPGTAPFTISDYTSFTFTVPSLLDPSLGGQVITPASWTANAGSLRFGSQWGNTLYLAIAPGVTSSSMWYWEFHALNDLGSSISSFSDRATPTYKNPLKTDYVTNIYPFLVTGSNTRASSYAVIDGAPGTWTVSAPVPLPTAAWLLGSGLVGLVGVARKQKTV